ncbi:hypothetical protein ACFFRR_010090 [Megaselia abdita]
MTIKNGFKSLLESDFSTIFMPSNHFEDEDEIPLFNLYRRLIPETELTNEDIANWASGDNECSRNYLTDEEIVPDIAVNNETETDVDDENPGEISVQSINPLETINKLIDYAEENLDLEDILKLRQMREKIVLKGL